MDIKELDKEFTAPTYGGRFGIVLDHGKGALLYDEEGKEYIDLGAGIAVNAFGVCDPEWVFAVEKQLHTLTHTSNLYYTKPDTLLAEELARRSGLKKVFFGNSGAEANECAIKCARKYSFDKYGKGRHVIVTLKGSFHGRTLATLIATGQDEFHTFFDPFPEGFSYAEPDNFESVKALCGKGDVCAVMMEMVQGEGGVHALNKDFVKAVADYCAERDILLIADEVQCGNGRTGKLYGYMHYGVLPDIVTTAKGLGGGLPIGACLMGEKCENTLTAGTHGSTFGGNPVVCAGALNILSRLDDNMLKEVEEKGNYIKETLLHTKGVKSVDGLGMMVGALLDGGTPDAVVRECQKKGVLTLTAHSKLRLLPPLSIPMPLLEKGMAVVTSVIEELGGKK